MVQQVDITPEDVRAWEKDVVTKEFIAYVKMAIDDNDNKVHAALEMQMSDNQASLYNAAMTALKEVLDIPDNMVEELKPEKEVAGEA